MIAEAFMLGVIAFTVYIIIKEIYAINLVLLIPSTLKPIPTEILAIIIFIIIRTFYKRYKFHKLLDFFHYTKTEYENEQAQIVLIVQFNTKIISSSRTIGT